MDYKVGALIEYKLSNGRHRRLRVLRKLQNIQPGHHGFEGVGQNDEGFWGFDSQITRVLDPDPVGK